MSRLYEDKIEAHWSNTQQTFDSPAFRLHKTKFRPKNAGETFKTNCKCPTDCDCNTGIKLNPDQLILHLGLTSIKDSISTNECDLADTLSYLGYELYKKQQMFLADMLGCHVIVITADGLIPIIKGGDGIKVEPPLGDWVHDVLDVKWRLPSVIPSPGEADIKGSEDCITSNNEPAHNELFQSMLRQLHKDLGIKRADVGSPKLLAVYYNKRKYNKPELIFTISSQLTSKNVIDMYTKCNTSYALGFVKTIDMMIPLAKEERFPISHFTSSGNENKCFIKQVELEEVDGLFKDVMNFCLGHQINFNSLIRPLQGLG